jgi:hypothetical protein
MLNSILQTAHLNALLWPTRPASRRPSSSSCSVYQRYRHPWLSSSALPQTLLCSSLLLVLHFQSLHTAGGRRVSEFQLCRLGPSWCCMLHVASCMRAIDLGDLSALRRARLLRFPEMLRKLLCRVLQGLLWLSQCLLLPYLRRWYASSLL